MGQIELSVELPVAQEAQLGVSSSSCSSNFARTQEASAERQESGSSCSKSMPAIDVQPDSKLKRANSVRNRAAFFEAMTKSSPEKASLPVSPPRGIPVRRTLPVVRGCKVVLQLCASLCNAQAHCTLSRCRVLVQMMAYKASLQPDLHSTCLIKKLRWLIKVFLR